MYKSIYFLLFFWLTPWGLKNVYPDIFGILEVQWPFFIITALLAPYVFLSSIRKNQLTISFLALMIPISNIGLYTSVDFNSLNIIKEMDERLQSPELFNKKSLLLEKAVDEKKEKIAALIYIHHGIKLPYQLSSGAFVKYSPEKDEIEKYDQQHEMNKKLSSLKDHLIFQLKERNILTFVQMICFGFVIGLMFLWQKIQDKT